MNFKAMNSHLTSEQIDGLLAGLPEADVSRHVAGCLRCTAEIASLRETFAGLRSSAAAAGEHHRRLAVVSSMRRVPVVAWAFAAAALAISVAAPVAVHHFRGADGPGPVSAVADAMSDEALLNSVDDDLASSVPQPMLPLSGTTSISKTQTSTQRKN